MTELVHVNILYMFTAFSITCTMGSGNMYIMLNMDEGIVRKKRTIHSMAHSI